MDAEPVTPFPPREVRVPVMSQRWTDAVFVHWETDPEAARRWLPPGTRLDVLAGRVHVGLICLTMDVSLLNRVPLPYVGSFPEVNVRLYTVDLEGRRGLVFCSLDADRLVPALAGRAGFGLPYMWSRVSSGRSGQVTRYAVDRRWPGPRPAAMRLAVRTGERIAKPSEAETFLTARWALHWRWAGVALWVPVQHEPWPLHRAELLSLDENLVESAGLPRSAGSPLSVMWSPGVRSRIGAPRPNRHGVCDHSARSL